MIACLCSWVCLLYCPSACGCMCVGVLFACVMCFVCVCACLFDVLCVYVCLIGGGAVYWLVRVWCVCVRVRWCVVVWLIVSVCDCAFMCLGWWLVYVFVFVLCVVLVVCACD